MNKKLNRFLKAQENDFPTALSEVKAGKKVSHWMWYVFPQLKGLGFSETCRYYALEDIHEAKAYLNHPVLGARLKEITKELLALPQNDARVIFGYPDDIKLKSCMTLFSVLEQESIFKEVIEKFFQGNLDYKTLHLLKAG